MSITTLFYTKWHFMTLIQGELTVIAHREKTSENSLLCVSHHVPPRIGTHSTVLPRIPPYYHAFQWPTFNNRVVIAFLPTWMAGYRLWWIMVEMVKVSTPWYRLIVIHGDLTVNVVFLQLLWAYNSVVFTHLTFYSTGMTFLWWYCPNASGCDSGRMVKKFNFLLHRNDFLSMVRSYCIRMWFYIKSCLV